METKIFKDELSQAAELIKEGQLVAVPTETVYGLACSGLDENAVEELYRVKGRPSVKPIALMISGAEEMDKYCVDIPKAAIALAQKFWPGPLTIILKAAPVVPEIVRAGGDTVGLRCPDHAKTLELLRLTELPLAAPSANPSGLESAKTAERTAEYFSAKIAGIIDGGECGIGRESTVIDMSAKPYKILREAALKREEIMEVLKMDMTVIGITGGTGCGKTTALNELEKMGALIIDCDLVYHNLLASNKELISELDARFHGTVKDGMLDRKALGAIVFSDPAALSELNGITHRYISRQIEQMLGDWAMAGGRLAAIDAIELIGSGISQRCDFTVGVLAKPEVRIKRIMARDGISEEYAALRVNAQKPDSYFIENCTYTVRNDTDIEDFVDAFQKLMAEVLNNG